MISYFKRDSDIRYGGVERQKAVKTLPKCVPEKFL